MIPDSPGPLLLLGEVFQERQLFLVFVCLLLFLNSALSYMSRVVGHGAQPLQPSGSMHFWVCLSSVLGRKTAFVF